MLLRNLASALRRQDWVTAFIELLIVVLGIFIALQVDAWNTKRLDIREERTTLERLLAESVDATKYLSKTLRFSERALADQEYLLILMSRDESLPDDPSRAGKGIRSLRFFPALTPSRSTYDELQAAGGLNLIRSDDVRTSIARYYAELESLESQLEYFRAISVADWGAFSNDVWKSYVTVSFDPNAEDGVRHRYDWRNLLQDDWLEGFFAKQHRNQLVFNSWREALAAASAAMCETIAAEIGSECTLVPE